MKMENGRRRIIGVYATRTRKQRNSLVKTINGIFVLTSLSLCTVSCNPVSIVSGFEKQTLRQGDNFTLSCRATGFYYVTITWLLDGLPLEYSTPKPPESIRLKADNPHSTPDIPKQEESRYLIKNSNELPADSSDGGDLFPQGVKDNGSTVIGEGHNDLTAERTFTLQNKMLKPSYKEPPPFIPSNIAKAVDGVVTVTSVLSLSNASVSDGGIYTCEARDVIRETARWSRKIAVAGTLSLRQNRPIFGLIDSVVIIPCTVLGTGENLPVRWFYQNFPSSNDDGALFENPWIALPDDHRQTAHVNGSFEIRDARKNNEGLYTCQADLNGKLTNMSTPLKVMVPPKVKPFQFPQVQVGKIVAEFCVVSEGDLPLDIAWYKDNALLHPSEGIGMQRYEKRVLSFTISSVSLRSAGNYSCCAKNNVSRTCTVSELVVLDPPKILGLPLQVTVISGNDVLIPCRVTGFPKPNVTWMRVVDDSKRDYLLVPRAKGSDESHHRKNFPRVYQTKNGSLVISNVSSSAHGGKYLCRAQNKVDELSRFVTLQVRNPARVTELTGTRDVVYRSDVIIECASWGDGDVAVRWFKNGKALKTSGRYIGATVPNYSFIETHSVSLERLIITNTTRAEAGLYTCKASNKYGTSSKDIDILVRAPPSVPGRFEVIDKGTSFLRMVISPGGDDGGSKLLSYVVVITKIIEEIFPTPDEHARRVSTAAAQAEQRPTVVKFPASATSADQEIVLDQLECGTEYEMSVGAVNEIGQSFKALHLTARTIGTVPIMLEANDLVVEENQTAVVLDLRAWQNGGCPITDLVIEYARHGDTEWNLTVVDGGVLEKALSPRGENGDKSGKNPGHVVIADLQTGTWYKILSSACNNAGCNYVTHSVPTLRADGSTVPPMKAEVEKEAAESDDARFLVPMVCGFGLVLLLVLLLLFYRHKQRSKKSTRMKEARKMAKKLLYKTEARSSAAHAGGMRLELSKDGDICNDSELEGEVQVETSMSCDEEDDTSKAGHLQMTTDQDDNTIKGTYFEDPARSDTFSNLAKNHASAACGSKNSNNSSANSRRSDGKKSLKDNAELAVFRGASSSDEEDHVTEPLVCDESAFGDSGTWSYFQPGSRARRPKKYAAIPRTETNHVPRRLSSTSSGTDEELAHVFGFASSKRKFKPVLEKEVLKSDINENYRRPDFQNLSKNQNPPTKIVKQGSKINSKKTENYYTIGEQERANSTGMVHKTDPRFFKALPGDALSHHRKSHFPIQPRPTNPNTNPFKPGFRPTQQQVPENFHRPRNAHNKGHTYSNGMSSNCNGEFSIVAQFRNPLNSTPCGERRWVDTYESSSSVSRSKPPSWGSTELDKHGFYTPPSINTAVTTREQQREATHTPEIEYEHGDRTYPCVTKDNRKLDTNSPRDSGIGSDVVSGSRHTASSVSPPHTKSRNVPKSLESLDEVGSRKGDCFSSCSNANAPAAYNGNDCNFSMLPPPTPPVIQTKLAPHIFVDISSSKCNTTPTRTSRSSYPPASSHFHLAPKKLDYLPTPPPSGPTSPEEPIFSRSRKRRGNEGWCVADLDGLAKYQRNSDSRLAEDIEITRKKAANMRDNSDAMYSVRKDERACQASTLV